MPETNEQTSPTGGGVATRLKSAAVLIPVTLAAVWAGGLPFAIFVAVAGVLMAWEWSRITFEAAHVGRFTALLGGAVLVAAMAGYVGLRPMYILSLLAFWAACVVLAVHHRSGRMRWAFGGVPYICLPVFALLTLRSDPDYGLKCVIWLLIVIWVTDTAAFFAGRSIGGPKLAPAISPKKTWSGAIAGVAAATFAGVAFARFAELPGAAGLGIMSGAVSIVGQVGDLLESALKRRFGVKDSSNLIPGHGGVLDRLDSLVTASVAALGIGLVHAGYPYAARGALVWPW